MRRLWPMSAAVVLCLALGGSPTVAKEASSAASGELTAEILVEGSPIHGANGLAIDQQGRLLVASGLGHELVAIDRFSGEILEHIGPLVGDVDVGGPDDVAVAPDGSICWTDTMGGFVNCLRADGRVDQQAVARGVNPIAFTADGRMFVAQAFSGDELYELDPGLIDPPRLIMSGTAVPPWPDQLNGFDFGPDGLLYAPRPFSASGGSIGRIDVDAASPTFEELVSGLPVSSVEFSPDGELYASLPVTGEAARVDLETGALDVVASIGPIPDNMVCDEEGRLFVSNAHDGNILSVPAGGGEATQLNEPGIILPAGIAAVAGDDGTDRLYVADMWSLPEFDGATGELTSIDWNSHLGGTVIQPATVAPDGDDVIVTSWFSGIVQVWDPQADTEVASWADFAAPANAIRFGDDLIVAELGTGSVVRQTPDGARSTIAEGLMVPTGLAATTDDLWVADWAAGTVWQIVTDGEPSMTEVATGLMTPEGLAVDQDGSLLVVESSIGRLTRILPSGETETVVDGMTPGLPGPPGLPPAYMFNGVAVGPSGAIYVTGDQASLVWRISEAPSS